MTMYGFTPKKGRPTRKRNQAIKDRLEARKCPKCQNAKCGWDGACKSPTPSR